MAIYRAYSKYIRTTPRKARLVADALSGKSVDEALSILSNSPKFSANPIQKTLESAVANAIQKGEERPNLVIKQIDIQEGPRFKRWHAAARGMAHGYVKRTCHIKIVLESKKLLALNKLKIKNSKLRIKENQKTTEKETTGKKQTKQIKRKETK